ncbi:MAG TPA: hypothetical protein VJR89_20020, partial [Polyangiales bacterium]|nr:hypothetical protein [Polyangiales bacterium]
MRSTACLTSCSWVLLIAVSGCTPLEPTATVAQCAEGADCSDSDDTEVGVGGNSQSAPDRPPSGAAAMSGAATTSAGGGVSGAGAGGAQAAGATAAGAASGGSGGAADQSSGGSPSKPPAPTCGNGSIDPGETCDPIAMCPTLESCRTSDPCLSPKLMGSASSCDARCETEEITACTAGDRCCPKDCNNANDSDCSVSCGDGVVTGNETCEAADPQHACPESCDDMDPCTMDIKTGTPEQCNVACSHMPITRPQAGDSCCPPGANAGNDSDCETKCGDGAVTGNETCDPASSKPCETPSSCRAEGCMGATFSGDPASCTAKCERKMITARQSGDGCCPSGANQGNDSDCPQKCGDGVRTGTELCDPCESRLTCLQVGCVSAEYTGSAADCTGQCVRGTVRETRPGDSCCPSGANVGSDPDCSPRCGDGVVSANETCDNGPNSPTRCVTESACLASGTSSGGCPKYSGNALNCTAKCTYDGPTNSCGGCKTLSSGTPNTDCKSFLSPADRDSCTVAVWLCQDQVT